MTWRDRAACKLEPPETFFPEVGRSTKRARELCEACPVTQECFDFAVRTKPIIGIWGGMSYKKRNEYLREAS